MIQFTKITLEELAIILAIFVPIGLLAYIFRPARINDDVKILMDTCIVENKTLPNPQQVCAAEYKLRALKK